MTSTAFEQGELDAVLSVDKQRRPVCFQGNTDTIKPGSDFHLYLLSCLHYSAAEMYFSSKIYTVTGRLEASVILDTPLHICTVIDLAVAYSASDYSNKFLPAAEPPDVMCANVKCGCPDVTVNLLLWPRI